MCGHIPSSAVAWISEIHCSQSSGRARTIFSEVVMIETVRCFGISSILALSKGMFRLGIVTVVSRVKLELPHTYV